MSIIFGKLTLSALTHVKMKKKGKSGKEVKGIFIPFDANDLFVSEKGNVFLDIVAFEMKNKTDDSSHIVKQSFSKEKRENMSEEEKREKPIIGNIKADNAPEATNNDAGGGDYVDADADQDLPF